MAADSVSLENPSRRSVLQVIGLGVAGFAVGCSSSVRSASAAPGPGGLVSFGPFVKIGSDNTVTVLLKHIEFGQGVSTGLTTIVAEEIDADWAQMRFEEAPAEVPTYGNGAFGGAVQGTGGSTAIANSWMQLRQAGAAARAMLVSAAAARWKVDPASCTVSRGVVSSGSKKATFGDLALDAGKLTPPSVKSLKLKNPANFRLIGKEKSANTVTGRADTPAKINGTAQYALDYHPEGLLVALVARSPRWGGKVASVDDGAARAVKGVHDVFQISNGVAVVATDYWAAKTARDALKITWDDSAAEKRSSDAMFADYRKLLEKPGFEARKEGKGAAALTSGSGKVFTVDFSFPYLAHAPMEPMSCTVDFVPGERCVFHSGSQMPTVDQAVLAATLGLQPSQVKIVTMLAGGSFGRKATPDGDLATEAAQIAKHLNGAAPVKLMWSREDDVRSGKYRPMTMHRMTAQVNEGKIESWTDRTVIQSIMDGTPFGTPGKPDISAIEGGHDIPYTIPNISVDVTFVKSPVTVLWWRSVGHTHTAFAKEHFFDLAAKEAGLDPLKARQSLLAKSPRLLGVLNLAAEKAGWGAPLPAGRGRGIAVHKAFDTYVAEVAEVTVKPNGTFSIDRVVCAVDCGIVVNPDIVRAQMEGGIGYGLSAALGEQITLKDGVPVQTNFYDYAPLRLAQMPKIEVYIVPSSEAPTGVGEPGLPPAAPAVANALLAATGKTVHTLPMGMKI
ncbi:MAG: molybdopterin-dependent oxidoreductase [Alphaproteobacteria bacterium]|nr:molybdopterin-dependent oxidoreductase [Alphaproteobacteria bacterium]